MSIEPSEKAILQKHLIDFLCKDVFNIVSAEEYLRKIGGVSMYEYKGNPMDPDLLRALKEEARIFKKSKLWAVLRSEMKHHAMQKILAQSKSEFDIIAPKMMVYLFQEVLDPKLNELSK